jgi:putative acyl-CoA dehydrogenase
VCLDVLRAIRREPASAEILLDEIRLAGDERLTRAAERALGEADETRARSVVERLAVVLQASLLARHAPAAVADAFFSSRVAREGGAAYGTLAPDLPLGSIVARHRPIS